MQQQYAAAVHIISMVDILLVILFLSSKHVAHTGHTLYHGVDNGVKTI